MGSHTAQEQHLLTQAVHQLREICGALALQGIDGFLHLQDISDCISQGLVHIHDQGAGLLSRMFSDADHGFGQGPCVFRILHESTAAALYIQNDGIRTVPSEHIQTVLSGGIAPADVYYCVTKPEFEIYDDSLRDLENHVFVVNATRYPDSICLEYYMVVIEK